MSQYFANKRGDFLKKYVVSVIISILIVLVFFEQNIVKASSDYKLSEQETFELLEKAFEAQVSLNDKYRTFKEVKATLSPYFGKEYISKFMNENVVFENEGYITYGTDFARFYVPFFSYSDLTKIVYDDKEKKMYVYEFFSANKEQPVLYGDHYEMLTLKYEEKKWIITEWTHSKDKSSLIKTLESQPQQEDNQGDAKVDEKLIEEEPALEVLNERLATESSVLPVKRSSFLGEQTTSFLLSGIQTLFAPVNFLNGKSMLPFYVAKEMIQTQYSLGKLTQHKFYVLQEAGTY